MAYGFGFDLNDALDGPVVLKGTWEPSSGVFPIKAEKGFAYIAIDDGVVDGVEFKTGDQLTYIADDKGKLSYVNNWIKTDNTDAVLSVNKKKGKVVLVQKDIAKVLTMPGLTLEDDVKNLLKEINKRVKKVDQKFQNDLDVVFIAGKTDGVTYGLKWSAADNKYVEIETSIDPTLSLTSKNAVENKVVTLELSKKEKLINKTAIIREIDEADDIKYPTEKAVATFVDNKKVIPDVALSLTSKKPVENKAIKIALDLKENLAARTTVVRYDGTAEDTKYPTEKAVYDLVKAKEVIVEEDLSETSENVLQNKTVTLELKKKEILASKVTSIAVDGTATDIKYPSEKAVFKLVQDREVKYFEDMAAAEAAEIEPNQLFVIGAKNRNAYLGTYMNVGAKKPFKVNDVSTEIIQVVEADKLELQQFIVVDKLITKPYGVEPAGSNGLDVTDNKILDSDGATFTEKPHEYRDGMMVSVKESNLQYRYLKATDTFVKVKNASGLRLEPIPLQADIHAIEAAEYNLIQATDTRNEYVFKLTANMTDNEKIHPNNIADDANTGKWVLIPSKFKPLRDLIIDFGSPTDAQQAVNYVIPLPNGETWAKLKLKYEKIEVFWFAFDNWGYRANSMDVDSKDFENTTVHHIMDGTYINTDDYNLGFRLIAEGLQAYGAHNFVRGCRVYGVRRQMELVDPNLIEVESKETLILQKDGWTGSSSAYLKDGKTWDDIIKDYSTIRISAYSPRYVDPPEPIAWGYSVDVDTIRNGVNLLEDSDGGVARLRITNTTTGELYNHSSSMAASDVKIYGVKAGKTVEKVDPNLLDVTDIPEDEIHHINEHADGSATTVTFAQKPYDVLIYARSQGAQTSGITISFKDLKKSGTLLKTISQHASRLTDPGDSSEIAHIDFDVKYVNDTTITIDVKRSGYTEKAGDYQQRSSYPIEKVIARYRGKENVSVLKPTAAIVPLGFEILFLEGITTSDSEEIITFTVPAGKRVIGLSSILIKWTNQEWLTPDMVESIDWQAYLKTNTSIKIQGKTSHTQSKPYMITLQLANN